MQINFRVLALKSHRIPKLFLSAVFSFENFQWLKVCVDLQGTSLEFNQANKNRRKSSTKHKIKINGWNDIDLKEIKSIKEIWFGEEINHVRKKHTENALEDVKICKGCPFKETYDWIKLN